MRGCLIVVFGHRYRALVEAIAGAKSSAPIYHPSRVEARLYILVEQHATSMSIISKLRLLQR